MKQIQTTLLVDNFYSCPLALQRVAKSLTYGDKEYEGHTYKGVGLGFEPENIWDYISLALNRKVTPSGVSLFRLGTATEAPTTYIHADGGIATGAAVLYLSEAPPEIAMAGTAFWRHKETGLTEWPSEQWCRENIGDSVKAVQDFWKKLDDEGADESKWQMTDLAGQRFNRISLYPSKYFHSRYPKDAWGSTAEDGRITWTGFYS